MTLNFNGYRLERDKSTLPSVSGIYCVYACTYVASTDSVLIRSLLYVGESENIHDRIEDHERLPDWKKKLKPSETLCYSYAEVDDEDDRHRAEAATINYHKPPCNTEFVNAFPFSTTTLHISGKSKYLEPYFTVYRS